MVNDRNWQRLRELFAATEGMTASEREAFLDREAADEPELRAELLRLFEVDATGDLTANQFLAEKETAPVLGNVGPYRLEQLLGEGGFGLVYLAEQIRPLRRHVALKLIKPGMDTKQVIARFEAERQALAVMDHPNIAKVFDAGETELGRPYFAMEYVDGLPITTYCDRHRLSIRHRLELFSKVCDAIQHAHQKGMIHRDIKPSNLMVATQNSLPAPKVIDFGIAKAMGSGFGDGTMATREGAVIGTMGSMSPEQAGAIDAQVDTRSDIYSLGVILYELLCGAAPFDPERLRSVTWTEAVRVIREEEPPDLTVRLGQSKGVSEVAERRNTESATLFRELKGDLEWITRRAIEKEPQHRYSSASELAADIHRHLADEPVLAGAPDTAYRVRKFVRRHRVGVIAASIVFVAIVGGGVAAGIGFGRAVHAERVARQEAESADRTTDFLVELFAMSTPDRSLGETVTARTLLDVGARQIQGKQIENPSVRRRLLTAIGSAYSALGLQKEGIPHLREAVDATRAANGEESAEFGEALSHLASELDRAGSAEEAQLLMDRSIEVLSRTEKAGRSALAAAILQKGRSHYNAGNGAAADSFVRSAIDILESEAQPDIAALISAYSVRAHIANTRYESQEALEDDLRALSLATTLYGERHSKTLKIHQDLANVYTYLAKSDSAVSHANTALTSARSMFPENHPSLAEACATYGRALDGAHKWDEALAAYEEALSIYRTCYGSQHSRVENMLYFISLCHESRGRIDLAIPWMQQSCEMMAKLRGATNGHTAARTRSLAQFYAKSGNLSQADALFRAAIPHLDPSSPHESASAYMGLANVCRDRKSYADADSFYTRAEALFDSTSAVRVYFGVCLTEHAYSLALQGRHVEAKPMMQHGMAIQLETDAEESPDMLEAFVLCAASRALAGDGEGAFEALRSAVKCGATARDVARFPELIALRRRADDPVPSPSEK